MHHSTGRRRPIRRTTDDALPTLGDRGGMPASADQLLWARELQALSFVVHIPIVCFGIALPALTLFAEGLWLRTGDPRYRTLAQLWSKAMAVLFAIGVVTGTILSFELGLLWPAFMANFGEVFGLAFAIEGFSFFAEAIFIAIYIYGWDHLTPRRHLLAGVPIVITGLTGSASVISVNGWMNHPVGFTLTAAGEVVNVRPWAALVNPNFWHELVHMYVAAFMVAGFVLAGFGARAWMRGDRSRLTRAGLVIPLSVAALAAPVQVLVGDWAGRTVATYQPTKLAAFEGLYRTEAGAPLHIGGFYTGDRVRYGIPLPKLLSLVSRHNPNATVEGLEETPVDDRPPVNVVRFAFQAMVGTGTALAALGVGYVILWWRHGRLPRSRWFYRALIAAGPLAVVALWCGWITTEVGRQPWVVYGVLKDRARRDPRGRVAVRVQRHARRLRRARGDGGVDLTSPARSAGGGQLMAVACLALALAAFTSYSVLGGADLGAGFWDLTAGGTRRGGTLRGLIERSMSPVWEANHVWLPFVLVVLWTAFPPFFGAVMSTLYIPLFVAAAGIIFRGAAFVLRPHATTLAQARVLGGAFALASVVVPFCFGAAVGGIASGRVLPGNAAGAPWSSWLNPTSIALGAVAVLNSAFLAAVFLAADARRAKNEALEQATRRRAIGAGIVTGAAAFATLAVARGDAPALYTGLTSGPGVAFVVGSALCGVATIALTAVHHSGLARATAAAAVACVTVGWAVAQSPDLLPGTLTIDQGAATDATLSALLIVAAVGALTLLPSLWLLWRLVLRGWLDKPYVPMDTRWRT